MCGQSAPQSGSATPGVLPAGEAAPADHNARLPDAVQDWSPYADFAEPLGLLVGADGRGVSRTPPRSRRPLPGKPVASALATILSCPLRRRPAGRRSAGASREVRDQPVQGLSHHGRRRRFSNDARGVARSTPAAVRRVSYGRCPRYQDPVPARLATRTASARDQRRRRSRARRRATRVVRAAAQSVRPAPATCEPTAASASDTRAVGRDAQPAAARRPATISRREPRRAQEKDHGCSSGRRPGAAPPNHSGRRIKYDTTDWRRKRPLPTAWLSSRRSRSGRQHHLPDDERGVRHDRQRRQQATARRPSMSGR
jgi:hypothetical protein